jgi:hypothetical protein
MPDTIVKMRSRSVLNCLAGNGFTQRNSEVMVARMAGRGGAKREFRSVKGTNRAQKERKRQKGRPRGWGLTKESGEKRWTIRKGINKQ